MRKLLKYFLCTHYTSSSNSAVLTFIKETNADNHIKPQLTKMQRTRDYVGSSTKSMCTTTIKEKEAVNFREKKKYAKKDLEGGQGMGMM